MVPQKYAFFDFDNTLAKGDSIVPFLLFCVRHHYASVGHLFKTVGAWIRHRTAGSDDYIPVKETTFSFLKGMTGEKIDSICIDFVDHVLAGRLYPEALPEIQRLRSNGFIICIVSASSEIYMKHIKRILPVDHVLATECRFADGVYTGKMGPNCKGEEKMRRIRDALPELPSPENCVCYGDSDSDAPMLGLGHRQYLINPRGNALIEKFPHAEIKKWKVNKR